MVRVRVHGASMDRHKRVCMQVISGVCKGAWRKHG